MGDGSVSRLEISVLGSPQIEVDGTALQVDTRKAVALLVYLAVTDRKQTRDALTGLLWPDYEQDRARAALRRTLSVLRKALGDRWVTADRSGVSLDLSSVWFDLGILRAALAFAETHGHAADEPCSECRQTLHGALDLVGGTFLHGFFLRGAQAFEEWQLLETENIEREVTAALDRSIRLDTAAGDLATATVQAQKKLARDPLDEPTHRMLMQLFAWQGMRAAALEQYKECVAVLDRELGVAPLVETRDLHTAITEGSIVPTAGASLAPPADRVPLRPISYGLRGRSKEWALLDQAYKSVHGEGAVAAVVGEAGIGKTRLARDFLESAADGGAVTVEARSFEGEAGLPYALITQVIEKLAPRAIEAADRDALLEAARLVPELAPMESPGPETEDGASARMFEGLRRLLVASLAGSAPGIVFLDDLQWSDDASLGVLAYLLRRLDESPLMVVLGWRSEEVGEDHAVRKLLAQTPVEARAELDLRRLNRSDVRALALEALEGDDRDVEAVVDRLILETEGNPFFVIEYLTAVKGSTDADWQLPPTVKELLDARIHSVGQVARQILGAAAVMDRSFDFETLWRASGRTEIEAVDALDELVSHGLVLASSDREATYEFSHDKLRGFAYDTLSPARRKVLHRRVAEAFIAGSRGEQHSVAALIARHLELGGAEAQAALYRETAAREARAVYANSEALEHYLAALALGHPQPAAMHEGAADMFVLLGDYERAIESYGAAVALSGDASVPEIERKLGEVHLRRGDWELSQIHLISALEAMDDPADEVTRAGILTAMSFNAYRKGELEEAGDLAGRALEAAISSDDARALAKAHNQSGILGNARGDDAGAVAHLEKSLALARELDDVSGQVAALNNLALGARSRGDFEEALALTQEALAVCKRQGDNHREAALHNNMADLLHQTGDTQTALEHLKTAAAFLGRIGAEDSGPLPEVWKLVEW